MNWRQLRRIWVIPVLLLAGATALVLGLTFGYDWAFRYRPRMGDRALDPVSLLFAYDIETLQNVLGNLAQTVAAVVGIVITVVAIVVQLAATRYTPRVTVLFFRARTNFVVLGFFVVTCVAAIWISLAVGNGFVPRFAVAFSVISVTLSLFLMVPYFAWVFQFLEPENVVARIRDQAIDHVSRTPKDVDRLQLEVLGAVEQLTDIAVAAIASKDKLIAEGAVRALRVFLVTYTARKEALPEAWFAPSTRLRENPDFVAMHPRAFRDLVRDGTWLEWKVLRQFQSIFNEALTDRSDINSLIAINTRYVGEAALAQGGLPVVRMVMKFLNTYMRSTINGSHVRVAYNVMNQYRQFVEALLDAEAHPVVQDSANHLRIYGQLANRRGLSFVTETIAYDVAALCEHAHRCGSPSHKALLDALLTLDIEPDSDDQERALRGVRKAQIQLATYYLQEGDEAAARTIHRDMAKESPARLATIREELLEVVSEEFWEVIDRGSNFEYLDERRREMLDDFYVWFSWWD